MEKINCGVAGVGSLGQHHARIYSTLPGAKLAGIYETNDARAAEICAKFACPRFATLAELGEACDAVSVVVPTDRHAEVAIVAVQGPKSLQVLELLGLPGELDGMATLARLRESLPDVPVITFKQR